MQAVELYYQAGETDKANELLRVLADNGFAMLSYYTSLPAGFVYMIEEDQNNQISLVQNMKIIAAKYNQQEISKEIDDKLNALIDKLENASKSQ
jgi:cobalamin biosynthesis Mg chelatase CobN